MALRVVIIGPAHPLRGGLATFNHRLCKQFIDEGHECCLFSFSLQYPALLFPGQTQFSDEPAPPGITIFPVINSIHPLNWLQVGRQLKKMKPDLIVVRYWIPFMGPALGTILRIARKNRYSRVVAITDNVTPHEKRPGDFYFTRYFLQCCDAYITMSAQVMSDLRKFEPEKPAREVLHPLYDNFGTIIDQGLARQRLGLPEKDKLILFFGLIRHYKGLDLLLQAIHILKKEGFSLPAVAPHSPSPGYRLVVAGEFYEPPEPYHQLIREWDIGDLVILKTNFIPDPEVQQYFCAADVVVQPYRNATQSGVTPLAYHFEKPMIVTRVGGLPDRVPHEKAGLVCEPEPTAIAAAIRHFFELGSHYFLPFIQEEKRKYSWQKLVNAIVELSAETSPRP